MLGSPSIRSVVGAFCGLLLVSAVRLRAEEPTDAKKIDLPAGRRHWAFQLPAVPPIPQVQDKAWPLGDIDRFILARLEAVALRPTVEADRYTLLRRLIFDLTGLPPSPEEIAAFVDDDSSQAYESLVDRLLASPAFGDRWGRHWLDVAQYADTLGVDRLVPEKSAWRYRDYVIAAFNKDIPFDQFLREQIAGDLMPADDDHRRAEQIVATAFLTQGPIQTVGMFKEQLRWDVVDNQVSKVGQVFLGLTMQCARCHDHKFDPISQHDYYAVAGIFQNLQVLNGFLGNSKTLSDTVRVPLPELDSDRAAYQRAMKAMEGKPSDYVKANAPERPYIFGAKEVSATNARITIRGSAYELGPEVPRGFIQVLLHKTPIPIPPHASGRLQLAQWMTDADTGIGGLTARVAVNRIWHHVFGRGLVDSVDNFGVRGEQPSHPKLLDYLAVRFLTPPNATGGFGWSMKSLIRELVLSRTYRMSSIADLRTHSPSAIPDTLRVPQLVDPDNRLLWRMRRRRLEAEAIRDTILLVSGQLDLARGGPSLPLAIWKSGPISEFALLENEPAPLSHIASRRSVYLPVYRHPPAWAEGLTLFDVASPSVITGARPVTTVPTQSLYLMNSPFLIEQGKMTAARLRTEYNDSDEDRIRSLYLLALSRPPSTEEVRHKIDALGRWTKQGMAVEDAWGMLCHAVFASNEFVMRL